MRRCGCLACRHFAFIGGDFIEDAFVQDAFPYEANSRTDKQREILRTRRRRRHSIDDGDGLGSASAASPCGWLRSERAAVVGSSKWMQTWTRQDSTIDRRRWAWHVCDADISTDELLFAVPCELHIGLETALGDPDCGAQFQEDGYALGAICAFVAKQYLCGGTQFGPYIASLNFDRNATDVLHWTVDEMKLLVTSGATFVEAEKLRDDAEDLVGYALNLEPLRRCVQEATKITDEDALDESIAEAVISAHASVLSRSFSVPGASWSNARELIPVLDALQHGTAGPTIWHDTENLDGMGECTAARARQPIASGEELWNWYGAHPDFVFATQFGFVPPPVRQQTSKLRAVLRPIVRAC